MKIWIIGARGQLGRALIDRCSALGISFIATTRKDADITDLDALQKIAEKSKCTHIINCAAYTNVDLAEQENEKAYLANATGPENMAITARDHGMRLVHVSTDYVFGGEKSEPYTEQDKPNPLGVYGKSKWEGEQRVLDFFPTACIVRTSWIFGHEGKNFISSLLTKMKGEEDIRVVEDQINRATYVRDLAGALLDISCHSGIYHFANEKHLSRFQIAKDFYEEAQKRKVPLKCQTIIPISHKEFSSPSPRPQFSVLDTRKITATLGRKPRMWKTVLQEYFDYVAPLH